MNIQYIWNKIIVKWRGSAKLRCSIDSSSKVESGSNLIDVTMDRYSFCGYNCQISKCKIGSFTSISNNVAIGGGRHPMEWVSMSPVFYEGRDSVKKKYSKFVRDIEPITIIGNDVWIGESVIIKSGVNIGTGSVIGMGSIVTKDVPPYAIYAGNPAKIIKYRFSDKIIEDLLNTKWWNWDERKMKEFAPLIKNPSDFIEKSQI